MYYLFIPLFLLDSPCFFKFHFATKRRWDSIVEPGPEDIVILTTTLTSTYTINITRTLTLFVYIDVGIQSTRTTRSELQINFIFRCMEKRFMADFVPVVFAVVLVSVPSSAVQSTCTFSSDKLEIWFKER